MCGRSLHKGKFFLPRSKTAIAFIILTILIFFLSFGIIYAQPQTVETTHTNWIFVIDLSKSMIGKGKGAGNIFEKVKVVLYQFIDECRLGDNVVIIGFGTDVNEGPTIPIHFEKDKELIKNEIAGLKADQDWTYTSDALEKTLFRLSDVEKKYPDYNECALILTDGYNDPPPYARNTAKSLNEVAKPYANKPWFVYQIALGSSMDTIFHGVLHTTFPNGGTLSSESAKRLSENLHEIKEKIIKATPTPHPPTPPSPTPEPTPVQTQPESKSHNWGWIILIMIFLMIVLVGIWFLKSRKCYVEGSLEYWLATQQNPTSQIKNLSELQKQNIVIGRESANDIVLADLDASVTGSIRIISKRIEGTCIPFLITENAVIDMNNTKLNEMQLYDRDKFQIGNYKFEYQNQILSRRPLNSI